MRFATALADLQTSFLNNPKGHFQMIATDDIVSITQNIFSTMLQMDPYPVAAESPQDSHFEMIGCIQIVGEWSGTVLLKVPEELISTAGSRMLMIDQESMEDADREDTLAELTNMVGGNIKSIVPNPSNLSLPTVTNGNDFHVRTFGSKPIHETCFQCDGHMFSVVILEKTHC